MAQDPRTFLVKSCEERSKVHTSEVSSKRDFFSAIGKIGDLEVLNDIGASQIGEGLRVLSKVSNSIRTGRSVVPGRESTELFNNTLARINATSSTSTNQGAMTVLDTVGLGNAIQPVSGLNPGVANRAYGQAQQIFEKVKQGNFELSDIPEYVSDLQNLDTLFRGIYTPPEGPATRDIELCGASPFAIDLIRFAPKQKFLFVVDITFRPQYQSWKNIGSDMAFVVKTSTRPDVSFEYEEINMYNFRTRIAKRTIYNPMTMTFYDDNQNNANLFYTAYMRAMSPIANIGGVDTSIPSIQEYQTQSMDRTEEFGTTFDLNSTPMYSGAASLGALHDNAENILAEIRLFHVFDYGRLMNVYRFFHPKITTLNLDDLTMSDSGNGTEMTIEFAYDGLYIIPNYAIVDTSPFNIASLTSQGSGYPLNPNFAGTIPQQGTRHAPLASNSLATDPTVSVTSPSLDIPTLVPIQPVAR